MMEEPPLLREPPLEFRAEIADRMGSVESEKQLEDVLYRIEATVSDFMRLPAALPQIDREQAEDLLAAAESWASVASYAVASFYGPQSPLRKDIAGWSKGAIKRLIGLSERLRRPVEIAARSLGADSWSLAASFPWGIEISLSWPVRQHD